ncbi:MAG: hypothetical protein M1820_008161 [Bogoriella megaspora]|nr:MAG: hypothetical protein M1820_008161 [Bogoriella megaspora]
MGKRKRSRKGKVSNSDRPLSRLWPDAVVEELIAFLEFARAEGFHKAQINESAAQHISIWSKNGRYSSDDIVRKLHRLRYDYGPENDTSGDRDKIYVEGSSSLTWFNEGQKEKIAKRTSEIKKEQELTYMYSPRRLRSGSMQIAESPSPASRARSKSRSTIGFSRGNLGPHVAAVLPFQRRHITSGLREFETSPSISSSDQSATKAEDTLSVFDTPGGRMVVTVEIPRASVTPTVPNSASTPKKTVSSRPDSLKDSYTREDRGLGSRNPAAQSAQIESLTEQVQCLEKDLHVLKRNSALDIDFWKASCIRAELECADFKRSQKDLSVKLGELLPTGGQITIDDIIQLQSIVDKLQSQLAHRIEAARMVRPGPHKIDKETALWVARRMEDAGRDLEEIFLTHDADIDWTLLMPHTGSLLTSLMDQVVPTSTRSGSEIAETIERLRSHGVTQKQFLQALSAAALVEWVFQASTAALTLDRYQGFCAPGTTSAYSKALAHVACKDANFASNIDLDVHRDIISEEAFKRYLEAKATDLGSRLQEALEPLLTKDEIANSTSETSDVEASLGERLAEVFTAAMEVQCRLRVSGRPVRCAWYSPGEAIDPKQMTVIGQGHTESEGQSRVSLTLLPGIHEILGETSGVGMSGFVDSCSESEPIDCLVRAVVWCGHGP